MSKVKFFLGVFMFYPVMTVFMYHSFTVLLAAPMGLLVAPIVGYFTIMGVMGTIDSIWENMDIAKDIGREELI